MRGYLIDSNIISYYFSENLIKQVIDNSQIFSLSDQIVINCVNIRRLYSIKIQDAIISAIASAEDLLLITTNVKDLTEIKGL